MPLRRRAILVRQQSSFHIHPFSAHFHVKACFCPLIPRPLAIAYQLSRYSVLTAAFSTVFNVATIWIQERRQCGGHGFYKPYTAEPSGPPCPEKSLRRGRQTSEQSGKQTNMQASDKQPSHQPPQHHAGPISSWKRRKASPAAEKTVVLFAGLPRPWASAWLEKIRKSKRRTILGVALVFHGFRPLQPLGLRPTSHRVARKATKGEGEDEAKHFVEAPPSSARAIASANSVHCRRSV